MVGRIAPGSADSSSCAAPSLERLAKVATDCLLGLGPVLGLAGCRVLGQLKLLPAGSSGMAVLIEGGGNTTIVVGVLSNPDGRAAIWRALCQLEVVQHPGPGDESDAIGELANVIAGRVKVALGQMSSRLSVP